MVYFGRRAASYSSSSPIRKLLYEAQSVLPRRSLQRLQAIAKLPALNNAFSDGDSSPFFFEFATPGVYLLTRHIVPMSNFCDRGSGNTNRHDNRELLIVEPSTPPLSPKNFNAHRTLRLRHVANDVVKHVS